MNTFFFKDLL